MEFTRFFVVYLLLFIAVPVQAQELKPLKIISYLNLIKSNLSSCLQRINHYLNLTLEM